MLRQHANYTYPKWKLHFYNGIYYTWETNTDAESGIQSFVRLLNSIRWGVSLSKERNKSQDLSDLKSWIQLYIQYKGR